MIAGPGRFRDILPELHAAMKMQHDDFPLLIRKGRNRSAQATQFFLDLSGAVQRRNIQLGQDLGGDAILGWLSKKIHMRGTQSLRNEAYE